MHSSLFNYLPVRDLNRVLRGSKLNHGAWIMLRFLYSRYILRNQMKYFSPWRRCADRQCVSGWRWMERFIDAEGNLCFFQNTSAVVVNVTQQQCDLVLFTEASDGRWRWLWPRVSSETCLWRMTNTDVVSSSVVTSECLLVTAHPCSHREGTHTFRNTHVF